uniref:Uncharacterized protein n=1 Tax=Anguilla anguilla TaxID=7936 RepID=A0A0E9TH67_ANGAN
MHSYPGHVMIICTPLCQTQYKATLSSIKQTMVPLLLRSQTSAFSYLVSSLFSLQLTFIAM